jgi:hypothetical protein
MSIRTSPQINGTRWYWMNDTVFHARRRISVSGYSIDLVLNKKPISPYSYDEDWYLAVEDTDGRELISPICLGVMVARDAVVAAENVIRNLIVGSLKF